MLAPVAKELNPSGPKLQQSIQSLKDQVQNLMFTVQNQTQSVSINNYPIPPSDNEISRRQKEAEEILGTGKRSGIRSLQDKAIPQDAENELPFQFEKEYRERAETHRLNASRIQLGLQAFFFVSAHSIFDPSRFGASKASSCNNGYLCHLLRCDTWRGHVIKANSIRKGNRARNRLNPETNSVG